MDIQSLSDNKSTICAVSTPPGVGGIAVVRISGPDAIGMADRIWHGRHLTEVESHTLHYGSVVDPDLAEDTLDTCVAAVFRGPKSFTGEDVVELSVHGSQWIQRELLELLVRQGCRLASAGEFTRRAFANGRLDLAQAEGVADVIAATSRAAARLASRQMSGRFSQRIDALRGRLVETSALLELELDFSEEDVEFASRPELIGMAEEIRAEVADLADTYARGIAVKNGIPVAIVGSPNAGKSTLLNRLLREDRAIVSSIPGTTRDTIEDCMEIDGQLYRFIDTAGLRDTGDSIESLGIQRAYDAIARASIVIWLVDPDTSEENLELISSLIVAALPEAGTTVIPVINKIDLTDAPEPIINTLSRLHPTLAPILISARTGEGLENLSAALIAHSPLSVAGTACAADSENILVTNARHAEALRNAAISLGRVSEGLRAGVPADLVAQDLREAIHHLSLITGAITTTEVLSTVFSRFCIGK